ncbi:hypothetical protein FACS1894156_6430 [Bacteroidia bacterium]|nr:hypothetical protein FACS1894156_6430 [Bacteroidia bacterium]
MTQEQKTAVMQTMRDSMDEQDKPKVGIFWYDPQTDELFGVTKINAQDLQFDHNGLKTVSSLHRDWWKKQQMRAKAKGQLSSIYLADYTKVPRGRIFQTKDEAFQIMCGSWVNDQIVELVTDEFDLQEQSVSVVIDEHWEIGHGWSE